MKILRYLADGRARYGVLQGSDVYDLEGDVFADPTIDARVGTLRDVQLLAPCVPTKIIAVGLNYADPTREGLAPLPSEPILSFKPPSSTIGSGIPIRWPAVSTRVDFEAELAVVIGKTTRNVTPLAARSCLLGVTCANDVTARDLQRREGQWARAKGFDTFCPLGPCIDTALDPSRCELVARVNREVRQSVSTSLLHFSPFDLVSYTSRIMTLVPGDVILTGTPPGSAALKIGDVVEVEIDGVGVLWNPVEADDCGST
ncbi:MAG: fumarylacetoacetate hydrolase family protein [Chloroflexota bacterium]